MQPLSAYTYENYAFLYYDVQYVLIIPLHVDFNVGITLRSTLTRFVLQIHVYVVIRAYKSSTEN